MSFLVVPINSVVALHYCKNYRNCIHSHGNGHSTSEPKIFGTPRLFTDNDEMAIIPRRINEKHKWQNVEKYVYFFYRIDKIWTNHKIMKYIYFYLR